uniref:Uncharacterized protein n=1 Tax=Plectus sambesii TaxID=2011161 RepID=A0A914VTK2_9BILA
MRSRFRLLRMAIVGRDESKEGRKDAAGDGHSNTKRRKRMLFHGRRNIEKKTVEYRLHPWSEDHHLEYYGVNLILSVRHGQCERNQVRVMPRPDQMSALRLFASSEETERPGNNVSTAPDE